MKKEKEIADHEEWLCSTRESSIDFSTNQVRKLKDIADWFFEDLEGVKITTEGEKKIKLGMIEAIPEKLFKSLQPDEFGISRIVADPLNQLPLMLRKISQPERIRENIYALSWEHSGTGGGSIRLQHRYRASDNTEAVKLAEAFVKRMTGRQKKVFQACWAMANRKSRRTYDCSLTELMALAYPARSYRSYFSVRERVDFYQDLLDLSQTVFYISKNGKGKRKKERESYVLPFITILRITEDISMLKESEKYPNHLSLSVLHNPLYNQDIMYSVGAAIKKKSLELRSDDVQLSEWIQIRKSQLLDKIYMTLERDFLINLAKLEKTNQSNPRMANKRLIEKLGRLKKNGIILDFPQKIKNPIHLKIR